MSKVEKLVAQWREASYNFNWTGDADEKVRYCASELEDAIAADKAKAHDGMLPDALVPHAKEWYRLCERRFSVDRMTISGPLAEAIVIAVGAAPQPDTATTEAFKAEVTKAREVWMQENPCEDGRDHVTPFDRFLYGG